MLKVRKVVGCWMKVSLFVSIEDERATTKSSIVEVDEHKEENGNL